MVRIPEHGRLLLTGWVLLLGCLIPVSLTAQDDTTAEATSAAADETASATAENTASASDEASDDQPASYEVKQQRLSVEVELNGLFQSEQTAPIRIRPKSWSTLVIREAVPHGTVVKAGDPILWLETKKLDEAITEAEQAIEQSHLSLELAHINREASLQTDELTLESTERTKREADEELDYFNETDRKRSEESSRFSLKNAENQLEYSREELEQLEKMYEADDLTEETEELVLKRTRNDVEYAEFSLRNVRESTRRNLDVLIPRRLQRLQDTARRADIDLQKLHASQPLSQQKADLEFHKLQQAHDKLVRRLEQLRQDRDGMVVHAPIDGVVYYGSMNRGRMSDSTTAASRLRPGASALANQVLMTVVATRPLQVSGDLAETDLRYATPGKPCKIEAKAFPDHTLEGRLKAVGTIPLKPGFFDCVIRVDEIPDNVHVVPGMTCTATIRVYDNRSAIVVNAKGVFAEDGEHVVYVLTDKAPQPVRRVVKLGHRNKEMVEVLNGLRVGDRILQDQPND